MHPRRWRQVKEILGPALELDPADRSRYLEEVCTDPDLLAQVRSFLAAYGENSDFIERPALDPPGISHEELAAGSRLGLYRLLRRIGKGGMGEVFLAEQERPMKRQVALKLIRPGWNTRQIAARFEAERQALALMSHPNIARVFDAGESPAGRSFFVMEYIEGTAITEHCDAERLGLRRRIELMIEVCRGVQHAHQKGIIHRDLKPSNVLVTYEDDRSVPKIIDFGIAKAMAGGSPESTLFTLQGQRIGTPEYMSPEQAIGGEIDTRSDVYSLGVLLYELLIGAKPFELKARRDAGYETFSLKTLYEHDPLAPSRRLRDLGAAAATAARTRGLDVNALAKRLRSDLDAITMKAIASDPDLRYASAGELAADLGRHLCHEPVLATAPSLGYQLRRLIRRHRLPFAAVSAVLLSLIAGIIGTSRGLVLARRAEQSAVTQSVRAQEEAERANREAATANRMTDFLVDIFETPDPTRALRPDMTLEEVLDRSVARVREELRDQPRVQARLLVVMGKSYYSLGQLAPARDLLEAGLEIQQERLGEDHPEVAETLYRLAFVYNELTDYPAARRLLERAVALREIQLGPDHSLVGSALSYLGAVLKNLGDYPAARRALERALAIQEFHFAEHPARTATILNNLGLLLIEMEEYSEAVARIERALGILQRARGEDHPDLAFSLNNLAYAVHSQGDLGRARALLERAVAIDEKAYGADHPNVALGRFNLGEVLWEEGNCAGAGAHFELARSVWREHFGASHPKVLAAADRLERLPRECSPTRELPGPPISR